MFGAAFFHVDPALALDDFGLDFPWIFGDQRSPVGIAPKDGGPGFFYAGRAKAVGFTGKTEGWFAALFAARYGRVAPLWMKGLGGRCKAIKPTQKRPYLVGCCLYGFFNSLLVIHPQILT